MFTTTLSDHAQTTLALLGKSGLVSKAYLAGGSALALYFGHRYSIDFDFFSSEKFDPQKLSHDLKQLGKFKTSVAKGISLIGEFNAVKLSYFEYNYPLIGPFAKFSDINIASIDDIAAMKLVAIMDRGTKKDFIDLFEMIKQGRNLEDLFKLYDKKYKLLAENIYSILRSLQYFDDAELSQMPRMIRKVTWKEVKGLISAETIRLAGKYL
ncbi:MAG: hypothetical protein UV73_C0014G0034 [Candidatus Gottesmanbacteria bacterium GW2011_GWA2_43_14]|uniref:Nucleotidyl transferase AbiEii/AbiGii toxin family protein n=1 Tax=Candidatus Gottesmanbacteria bacterium GW2011_GWA2_43_14 TaxID=1618443 RepID=A0A0G1DDS3_9BACT|nr:MAG: hypothetical protein UV73_C0014G0034 [Candidatus Gottesmanbacteria bacterium GW2011_GWA2_43_14]